ncbi:VOC family protein [Nocardiopsis nanhaiensis]
MSLGSVDQWVVNAVQPSDLARFWALLVGGEVEERVDGWAVLHGASGMPRLSFQPTPEHKRAANRIHLDVQVADIAEATHAVVERGATTVGAVVTDEQGSFQVLQDPEGNEFCFVAPSR